MRSVDIHLIEELIHQAQRSPRKRAHFLLHKHSDPVQRLVNAIAPGSYVPPHKHENPDKIELFTILKGSVAALKFTPGGKIDKIYLLEENGPMKIVDIRPRIYHSFIALEPSALLEIIQSPYNEKTHKHWPSWAPKENTLEAAAYLKELEKKVKKYMKK